MKASLDGPRDEHEREADRVAERVSSSVPHGGISQANRAAGDPAPPIVEDVLRTRGKPLDAATRAFMEPRLGHDLADVQLHTDARAAASAHAIRARAYTFGTHLVFGAGQYAPASNQGRQLLAHELTHVVQQRDAPATVQRAPDPKVSSDESDAPPVVVAGEAEGERFLYRASTANFRRGEERRLRAFAKVLTKDSIVSIHGFASEEGDADLNERLSIERAEKAKRILMEDGVSSTQIEGVFAHGATGGGRAAHRSVVIDVRMKPGPRVLDPATQSALAHLHRLAAKAAPETDGADFEKAVEVFRSQLELDLKAVPDGQTLPDDLQIVVKALLLWDVDKGDQWGEGRLDSTDFTPSAAAYAVVPAAQNKCNAFLGEVIYKATGVVHQGHLKAGMTATDPRAWFPFRASEWGDASFTIPHFPVVTSPVRADILCTGGHVGIYLGNYAGKDLYISARDDSMGVFGLGEQFTHGIQIKYTKAGIFRRFQP